jgi:hypothetical protein
MPNRTCKKEATAGPNKAGRIYSSAADMHSATLQRELCCRFPLRGGVH